jgi:hypothetical protein
MSSSSSQNNDTIVTTKWGTVIVLKNDNYAAWRNSVQLTLTSANAWSIITRNKQPPHLANQLEDYNKRKTIAMQIINMSLYSMHHHLVVPFATERDPEGAYDELRKLDRANDPIWVQDITEQYRKEVFDPTRQTLQEFVSILRDYSSKLSGSNRPINNTDILDRIYNALPSRVGSEVWQTQK